MEKHGLDFIDAPIVLQTNYIVGNAKMVSGEDREIATGLMNDIYVTVVFTRRLTSIRIISFRRARHGEKQRHQEIFGG